MSGWKRVEIAGKPADVFAPDVSRNIAVFLHTSDGRTLADSVAEPFTVALRQCHMTCVCPIATSPWWSDRVDAQFDPVLSAERFLLEQLFPWIAKQWPFHRHCALFGIGLGGQGALRLAFKHPDRFPVVAAIAPVIETHLLYGRGSTLDGLYTSKEQCRQDTAPMHIHPSNHPRHILFTCDPTDAEWHRGCDRLHEKMAALGVAHEFDLTSSGGGHSWVYFNAQAQRVTQFLKAGLTTERRRLV